MLSLANKALLNHQDSYPQRGAAMAGPDLHGSVEAQLFPYRNTSPMNLASCFAPSANRRDLPDSAPIAPGARLDNKTRSHPEDPHESPVSTVLPLQRFVEG